MDSHDQDDRSMSLAPQFSTLADIERAISRLRLETDELIQFQRSHPSFDDPAVKVVEQSVKHTVVELFGLKSPQSERFRDFAICSGAYMNMPHSYIQQCFDNGFPEAIQKLEGEIHFLNELKAITDGLRERQAQISTSDLEVDTNLNFLRDVKLTLPASGGSCLLVLAAPLNSNDRARHDLLIELAVRPVLSAFNYLILDAMPAGKISQSIIHRVESAELVIVDLTDPDPLVFYQLGLRQASGRPLLLIIDNASDWPFEQDALANLHIVTCDLGVAIDVTKLKLKNALEHFMRG